MAWDKTFDFKIANGIKFMHVCNKEIIYEPCDQFHHNLMPRVQLFGDVGHGKSTLGNYILKESLVDKKATKIPPAGWFKTKRQTSAVTKKMTFQTTDTINLIDTCGFNDLKHNKTNELISMEILSCLRSIFTKNSYINGFIFCVLIKRNLVIEKKTIDTLYNMLSSLGYIQKYLDCIERSYDDINFDHLDLPFIKIVVNNFSKNFGGIKLGENDIRINTPRENFDSGRSSPMTRSPETCSKSPERCSKSPERVSKTKYSPERCSKAKYSPERLSKKLEISPNRNTSNTSQLQKSSSRMQTLTDSIDDSTFVNTLAKKDGTFEMEHITADSIKQSIKQLQADKIIEIHNVDKTSATKIVESLLPDKSFYFYKANLENKKRKKQEKLEIKSLIFDILSKSNSYTMDFQHAGNLKPVLRPFDNAKYLQHFYCEKISMMLKFQINFRTELIDNVSKHLVATNLSYYEENLMIEYELNILLEAIFFVNNHELTVEQKVKNLNNPCLLKDKQEEKKDFWMKADRKLLLNQNSQINKLYDEIKKNILIQISIIYNNLLSVYKSKDSDLISYITPIDWKDKTDKYLREYEEINFKIEFNYENVISIIAEENYKMIQETNKETVENLSCNDLKIDELLDAMSPSKLRNKNYKNLSSLDGYSIGTTKDKSNFDNNNLDHKKENQKDILIKNILINDLYKENELLQSDLIEKKARDGFGILRFCSDWGLDFCLPQRMTCRNKSNRTISLYGSRNYLTDRTDNTFDFSRNLGGIDDSMKIVETNIERNFTSRGRIDNEINIYLSSGKGIVESGNVNLAIKKSDVFIKQSTESKFENSTKETSTLAKDYPNSKKTQSKISKEKQLEDSSCKIY